MKTSREVVYLYPVRKLEDVGENTSVAATRVEYLYRGTKREYRTLIGWTEWYDNRTPSVGIRFKIRSPGHYNIDVVGEAADSMSEEERKVINLHPTHSLSVDTALSWVLENATQREV